MNGALSTPGYLLALLRELLHVRGAFPKLLRRSRIEQRTEQYFEPVQKKVSKIDPHPLHRIEFCPPKFFSKTFKVSIIFYSTSQISWVALSKSMQIPKKRNEPVRNHVQTVGTC